MNSHINHNTITPSPPRGEGWGEGDLKTLHPHPLRLRLFQGEKAKPRCPLPAGRGVVLLFLLFIIAFSFPAQAQDKVFNAEYFTLENGMEIVVIPQSRVPAVTHMVWYRVGAADEPPGKSGIAHYLEHLFFKGSEGLEPGEFSRIVKGLGGNDNAFTSQDYTAYFQSVPAQHLETVMRMEAGRLRGLSLPPDHVASELQVVLEERRQRTENDPRARFAEHLRAALFPHHPYGTPVIGWYHEMETLTRADAKSFYDRWYGPNNAILVVSGDVTGQQVYELAQRHYGALPRSDLPERQFTQSPPLSGETVIRQHSPVVRQPLVQMLFRVPSARQDKEAALALQILEEIMGGGPTSRIYNALVVEQKIATGAGLRYNGTAWDDGTISLYATPAPGMAPEDLRAALEAELEQLISGGVTEVEVSDAVKRLQNEAIYARDSLRGPAMIIGYNMITGSSLDDIEYWPRDIAQVTPAQVRDVAARYLVPGKGGRHSPVIGYLLPKGGEE